MNGADASRPVPRDAAAILNPSDLPLGWTARRAGRTIHRRQGSAATLNGVLVAAGPDAVAAVACPGHLTQLFRMPLAPISRTVFRRRIESRARDELFDLLRIPSVSARSEHNADTARAAEWVARRCATIGLDGRRYIPPRAIRSSSANGARRRPARRRCSSTATTTCSRPSRSSCGTARRSSRRSATARSSRAARWTTRGSSICTSRRSRRISRRAARCRSTSSCWRRGRGSRQRASGRVHRAHADRLRVRLRSSSPIRRCSRPGLPSILSSLRGLAYFQIDVQGPAGDLHSGIYGGAVMNPAMALARILATMHDANGHIAIPGFYDAVRDWGDAARARHARAAVRRRPLSQRNGLAGAVRREGLHDARAPMDATHVRSQWDAQRLHRRRREDRAPRARHGESELPPGSRPDARPRSRTLDAGARRPRRAAGRAVTVTAPPRRHAVARQPRRSVVRRRAPRAGDGVRPRAGDHGRRRLDPGGRRLSDASSRRPCCSSASGSRARTRTRPTSG